MRTPKTPVSTFLTLAFAATFLVGCASTSHQPDEEMLSAPTGTWIGQGNGVTLDIQASGDLRYTVGDQELLGTWEAINDNTIRATINGQTYDMPYNRLDFNLTITLPGESSPSEFTLM